MKKQKVINHNIDRIIRPVMQNNMLRIFFSWTKLIPLLILIFLVVSCAPLTSSKSVFSSFNPPQYLFNSGILKLERTLWTPRGDGANLMYFSHTGKYLATSGMKSRHINIWDLDTGELLHTVDMFRGRKTSDNRILSWRCDFEPDDSRMFFSQYKSPGYLELNLKDGSRKVIKSAGKTVAKPSQFSPNGKFAIGGGGSCMKGHECYEKGGNNVLLLKRVSNNKTVAQIRKGHGSAVMRFSPDGRYVVDYAPAGDEGITILREKKYIDPAGKAHNLHKRREDYLDNLDKYEYPEIRFWSVPDLKLVRTIDNVFKSSPDFYVGIHNFDISPDSQFIAVAGSDDTGYGGNLKSSVLTRIFDYESGVVVKELPNISGGLYFSHNSKYLIVTSTQEHKVARIYSVNDWKLKEQIQFEESYWSIDDSFCLSGNRLAVSNGRAVYLWKIIEDPSESTSTE